MVSIVFLYMLSIINVKIVYFKDALKLHSLQAIWKRVDSRLPAGIVMVGASKHARERLIYFVQTFRIPCEFLVVPMDWIVCVLQLD